MKDNSYLLGRRFGRYEVIGICREDDRKVLCVCDCGTKRYVDKHNLISGKTKSCGCYKSEITSKISSTHGESKTRLYQVWSNMRRRCNDPTNNRYSNYGGKGVRVCDDWNKYENFRDWANKTGYDPNARYGECTIDRIDVNGDYDPNNCRWTSIQEQNKNRTSTKYITYNDKTLTATEWDKELGFGKDRVASRLRKGWSIEKAITTPV